MRKGSSSQMRSPLTAPLPGQEQALRCRGCSSASCLGSSIAARLRGRRRPPPRAGPSWGLSLESEEAAVAGPGLVSALVSTALTVALTLPSPQEPSLTTGTIVCPRASDPVFCVSELRKLSVENLVLRMGELSLSDSAEDCAGGCRWVADRPPEKQSGF